MFQIASANYLDEKFGVLSSPAIFSKSIELYLLNETKLNGECRDQLWEYVENLQTGRQWALQLYDASSKLPSGILDGNFYDLGSFDECIGTKSVSGEVAGKYCLGDLFIRDDNVSIIILETPLTKERLIQTISFSICFPNLCSAEDMQRVAKAIGLNLTLTENMCQTEESQPKWDSLSYATLSFFCLIALLMVVSTIYEAYTGGPRWVLKSFSVISNGKKILKSSKSAPHQITCLHGLRTIAIAWVVCGHTVYNVFKEPAANSNYVDYWVDQIQNMPIWKTNYCVEIFFVISGVLVSYNFMKKSAQKFDIIYYYVERYLRLTPPFAIIIFFMVGLYKFFGSGPLWTEMEENSMECRTYWWASLLYIQIYGFDKCISYTWYLSVDYQFFILSPFLLIPMKRLPKLVFVLTVCLIVIFMVVTVVFVKIPDLYYNFFLPSRAPPWLVGFLLGYLLSTLKENNKEVVLNRSLVIVGWVTATVLAILCCFGAKYTMVNTYNELQATICMLILRFVIALPVAWIIFSCHMGYGGIVNTFLSNPVFEVFSKLSYCIYLVHFFVVKSFFKSMRVAPFLTNYDILAYYIPANIIIAVFWGSLLSLSIELPVQQFVSYLMNIIRKQYRSAESQREVNKEQILGSNNQILLFGSKMRVVYIVLITMFKRATANYLDEKFGVLSSPAIFSKSIERYLLNETKLNGECRDQLWEYVENLQTGQQWALQLYDASSKLPSGILDGNFYDLGSFDECIETKSVSGKVTGKYCLGDLFIRDDNIILETLVKKERLSQNISFSICLPNLCSTEDMQHVVKSTGLNLTLTENKCQTKESQPKWDSLAYATLSFFCLIALLMVVSTIYEACTDFYYNFFLLSRGSPWLVGFLLGYFIFTLKENNKDFALNRVSIVNTFLSNPVFEVLSKLSYCIYLVHYFVVKSFFKSMRVAPFLTNYDLLNWLHYCALHCFLSEFQQLHNAVSYDLRSAIMASRDIHFAQSFRMPKSSCTIYQIRGHLSPISLSKLEILYVS
ncbi:hypothetical protein RI129_012374 [Pyrocoelia pectoralis]|uniref:Nose resistant-to-fluoxetine protein N-terminal domain-containing protein n=1 Tax=Pyrocoelia pectoralis TaxID=417401 RepID=A0AAN7V065_9COLE